MIFLVLHKNTGKAWKVNENDLNSYSNDRFFKLPYNDYKDILRNHIVDKKSRQNFNFSVKSA
jgi:hypothetical protein